MKQHYLKIILVIWLLTACQSATTSAADQPAVEVNRIVVTTEPDPTPAVCTPLPEGMTLRVEALSETEARVGIEGLQPGEEPILLFTRKVLTRGVSRIESQPVTPVGSDGRFIHIQPGLYRLPESEENRWQVMVIHSRGVACDEVVLP
ncbi:MAG: hypothetical protein D6706_11300 [Chloroflexi bacterium]|nr:MAG: hypothetical protein D6706_11300 [Chloroflexota bacterium]